MNEIMYKATSQGGIITTAEFPNQSDYQKIVRAKERGELIRVRHGVYAVPDALFNTMIDIERIVPTGIVCLYNAWAYHQLSTFLLCCYRSQAKGGNAANPTDRTLLLEKGELGVWCYGC